MEQTVPATSQRPSGYDGLKAAVVFFVSIIIISYILTPLERRLYWGYWFSRPTLSGELKDLERVLAVSEYRIENSSPVTMPDEKYFEYDLDGTQKLFRDFLATQNVFTLPDISEKKLKYIVQSILTEGWAPVPEDAPYYRENGKVKYGLSVMFKRGNTTYILTSYNTGTFANDRYGYAEVLHRQDKEDFKILKEIHYYVEVAGLEGMQTVHYWIFNIITLTVLSILVAGFVWITQHIRGRFASRRPTVKGQQG